MWNQEAGEGERRSKKKTAKKMISFMKGMTKLMEQMEEIQQDGEETSSGEESSAMWPLYSGINRSFSKMMQLAGSAISKKITKNLALRQGHSPDMGHDHDSVGHDHANIGQDHASVGHNL